ncbi:ACD11 protein [Cinnamomum micranthum f. kanehirae]|uniref:ACD11 protein n=1 Tax=Cinnamomum micranthum f. kanehirae TaxID=337451 RepID=A0A443N8Y9_9MAGN|nr:ACD11 protein [Cinnamomum micranthum f. kanehirae]
MGEEGSTDLKPLSAVVEAFEELARIIESGPKDLRLAQFSDACSLVSVLFGCLGIAFKFAELEYVAKVHDLLEASKTYNTLENVLDHDIDNDTVRKPGSHSRNLRRVRQGLDLLRTLFEQFLSPKKAVSVGMYALPTREQLILKLSETGELLISFKKNIFQFTHFRVAT